MTLSAPLKKFSPLLLASSCLVISFLHLHLQVHARVQDSEQARSRSLPPRKSFESLGSSLAIECEAGDSPPPSICWLKNGNSIVQNELDDNLVIDPASDLNAGKSASQAQEDGSGRNSLRNVLARPAKDDESNLISRPSDRWSDWRDMSVDPDLASSSSSDGYLIQGQQGNVAQDRRPAAAASVTRPPVTVQQQQQQQQQQKQHQFYYLVQQPQQQQQQQPHMQAGLAERRRYEPPSATRFSAHQPARREFVPHVMMAPLPPMMPPSPAPLLPFGLANTNQARQQYHYHYYHHHHKQQQQHPMSLVQVVGPQLGLKQQLGRRSGALVRPQDDGADARVLPLREQRKQQLKSSSSSSSSSLVEPGQQVASAIDTLAHLGKKVSSSGAPNRVITLVNAAQGQQQPRNSLVKQVAPLNSTTSSPVAPPRKILRRRRIKTLVPVGLSSWFLGGIRDLDARHWKLPVEVISKLAVNDVDLQHSEPPTPFVGAPATPDDMVNISNQVQGGGSLERADAPRPSTSRTPASQLSPR